MGRTGPFGIIFPGCLLRRNQPGTRDLSAPFGRTYRTTLIRFIVFSSLSLSFCCFLFFIFISASLSVRTPVLRVPQTLTTTTSFTLLFNANANPECINFIFSNTTLSSRYDCVYPARYMYCGHRNTTTFFHRCRMKLLRSIMEP